MKVQLFVTLLCSGTALVSCSDLESVAGPRDKFDPAIARQPTGHCSESADGVGCLVARGPGRTASGGRFSTLRGGGVAVPAANQHGAIPIAGGIRGGSVPVPPVNQRGGIALSNPSHGGGVPIPPAIQGGDVTVPLANQGGGRTLSTPSHGGRISLPSANLGASREAATRPAPLPATYGATGSGSSRLVAGSELAGTQTTGNRLTDAQSTGKQGLRFSGGRTAQPVGKTGGSRRPVRLPNGRPALPVDKTGGSLGPVKVAKSPITSCLLCARGIAPAGSTVPKGKGIQTAASRTVTTGRVSPVGIRAAQPESYSLLYTRTIASRQVKSILQGAQDTQCLSSFGLTKRNTDKQVNLKFTNFEPPISDKDHIDVKFNAGKYPQGKKGMLDPHISKTFVFENVCGHSIYQESKIEEYWKKIPSGKEPPGIDTEHVMEPQLGKYLLAWLAGEPSMTKIIPPPNGIKLGSANWAIKNLMGDFGPGPLERNTAAILRTSNQGQYSWNLKLGQGKYFAEALLDAFARTDGPLPDGRNIDGFAMADSMMNKAKGVYFQFLEPHLEADITWSNLNHEQMINSWKRGNGPWTYLHALADNGKDALWVTKGLTVLNYWLLVAATFDIQVPRASGDGGPVDSEGLPVKLSELIKYFLDRALEKIEERAKSWQGKALLNKDHIAAVFKNAGNKDWAEEAFGDKKRANNKPAPIDQMQFPRPNDKYMQESPGASEFGAWGVKKLTIDASNTEIALSTISSAVDKARTTNGWSKFMAEPISSRQRSGSPPAKKNRKNPK